MTETEQQKPTEGNVWITREFKDGELIGFKHEPLTPELATEIINNRFWSTSQSENSIYNTRQEAVYHAEIDLEYAGSRTSACAVWSAGTGDWCMMPFSFYDGS